MISDNGDLGVFFENVGRERGKEYAARLKAVINENVKRGRLAWYLDSSDDHTVVGYAEKVMHQYDVEHEFIDALKIHKDPSTWTPVQQDVRGVAYRLLFRLEFMQDVCILVSDDIAQDVCLKILSAHYPYDSNFKAWVTQITNYTGYRYAKRRWADEKKTADIEKLQYIPHENVHQEDYLDVVLQITERELNEAIQQLSALQQEVVLAHYLLGKSLAEIAKELDALPNTIYKRHHDALKRLDKIFGKTIK